MQALFQEKLTFVTQDLLAKMGFSARVKTSEMILPDNRVNYHIDIEMTDGQSLLIGQQGAHMSSLLQIIRLITRSDQPENAIISLDINHYLHEKKELLKKEALEASLEVETTGLPITLRPMLPYERKLVHTFFAQHPSITTESVGQGKDRKVLLKRRSENLEMPTESESTPLV